MQKFFNKVHVEGLQHVVSAFLNGEYNENYKSNPYINTDLENVYFNSIKIAFKSRGKIFIINDTLNDISDFLSLLIGTEKVYKNGDTYNINGIEWDGSKVNIELFK